MKEQYKIMSIQHSGRKGIRFSDVDHPKYDGLLGCTAIIDLDDIKQFQPYLIDIIDSPQYEWWNISPVVQVGFTLDEDPLLVIETVNTIYTFKKVKGEHNGEHYRSRVYNKRSIAADRL